MEWKEALEIVIEKYKHEPLRAKCSDSNPNTQEREIFRRYMIQMASQIDSMQYPVPIRPSELTYYQDDLLGKVRITGGTIYIQPGSVPASHFQKMIQEGLPHAVQGVDGQPVKIPSSESMKLLNEIRACPHHHNDPPCGCGGARCRISKMGKLDSVHGGSMVNFWDCAACLRPGNEMYSKNATFIA
jgi:hypothetical protein